MKKIGDSQTGSWRKITMITPDTFSKPIKVISTLFSLVHKKGDTAISEIEELNYMTIDITKLKWKIIKKHKKEKSADDFHEKIIRER